MITIIARVKIKEGKEDDFLKLVTPLVKASNEEAGCISYRLFIEAFDKGSFAFIEQWKDEDAIDFHGKTPHFQAYVAEVGDMTAAPMDVSKLVDL